MDDPRNLWQTQEVEEMRISVEELRAKAAKFQSRIRWRNVREQVVALIWIVAMAGAIWTTPQTTPRIGYTLWIAFAVYYIWYLRKWATPKSLPADMGRADCVRFYQSELARQRDLVGSIWKWAIGPLLPASALLSVYYIVIAPPRGGWLEVARVGVSAAVIWVIGWLNQRAARRLDGRIRELDRELGNG